MSDVENTMFDPMQALHGVMGEESGDVLSAVITPEQPIPNAIPVEDNVETRVKDVATTANNVDGAKESLDKMFGAIMVGGLNLKDEAEYELMKQKSQVFKQAIGKFLSTFRDNIFENEYAVLYSALKVLNVRAFSANQLDTIFDNSTDDILGSNLIHLDAYSYLDNGSAATDEEKLQAFKYDVRDKFRALSHICVTIDEFESACEIYKLHYKNRAMESLTQTMAMIMSEGVYEKVGRGRNRLWKGIEDCKEYYGRKIAIINALDHKEEESDSVVDESWLTEEMNNEKAGETPILMDTGIQEIDAVYGGFARGNMFEVMGAPKSGKTTFLQYMTERCLRAGLNVAVWPLEGTKEEWIAAIISLMVKLDSGIVISKRRIMKRIYRDDREKQAVSAAKIELANSVTRGKLSFIGKACFVENMINDLNDHWKNKNAYDVIVMDSPILAQSLKSKSKTDAAAEAYTSLKHYISYELPNKALALVTAQLKQVVIDELRNNPHADIDVNAGGVTAESIRSPDFVTCLTSTKEERKQGQVRMNDVASRHSESFESFYMGAELGCCYFYSDPGLNDI